MLCSKNTEGESRYSGSRVQGLRKTSSTWDCGVIWPPPRGQLHPRCCLDLSGVEINSKVYALCIELLPNYLSLFPSLFQFLSTTFFFRFATSAEERQREYLFIFKEGRWHILREWWFECQVPVTSKPTSTTTIMIINLTIIIILLIISSSSAAAAFES